MFNKSPYLSLAFFVLFVPILLNVPPNCAMFSATSGAFRQVGAHLARGAKNVMQTAAKEQAAKRMAQPKPNRMPPKNTGRTGNSGTKLTAETTETTVKWQRIAPNLPAKGTPQIRALFRYYTTLAGETLKQQLNIQKTTVGKVKSRLLFGLDKLPSGVQQHAHLPQKLGQLNEKGAVSRTMHLLGKRMYDSIWQMSNKLKELPPKTTAVLAVIFGYAEIAHTRDEWSQASLKPFIDPDSVGFSLPRTMEQFNEGLVNAALDILPDFAFAVPVSLFVANPPAAILWAGWMAVGEYFAKKSWSLVLRDAVLPTKSGGKFVALLEDNKVPVERIFVKQGDNEEGQTEDDDGEEKSGKKETVPILNALAGSQVDSNLYQYLFMNTLRAYYVTATSIYSYFMGEIEKAQGDDEQQKMTEFARDIKRQMAKNEAEGGPSANAANAKGNKFRWLMGKPKLRTTEGQKRRKEGTGIELIEEYLRVNTEPISTRWVETLTHFGGVMLDEMDKTGRESVEELARGIAHEMVYKTEPKGSGWHESLHTTAQLISRMSTSPEVLEELVKVKLGGDIMPNCDPLIEKTMFAPAENSLHKWHETEEGISAQFGQMSLAEGPFDTNEQHFPICQLSNGRPKVATNAQIEFLPVLDDQMVDELKGLFKEKVTKVMQTQKIVNTLNMKADNKQKPRGEAALGKGPHAKEQFAKALKANSAAAVFSEAGHRNRLRQRYVVTRGAAGTNPLLGGAKRHQKQGLALVRKKK